MLLTGCESLRRKFVRKPKHPQRVVALSTTKTYEIHRTPLESYERHYLQWVFWNAEVLTGLETGNQPKVIRGATESASELRKLQALLEASTAQRLNPVIAETEACAKRFHASMDLSLAETGTWRTRLERQQRLMHREFLAKRVADLLKPAGASTP
ncbi:MAG: hypothetical protein HY597_02315 [Candidatus Omnitrophica bacterium]|nr:hypothetical protein [Candidatus Omnitrophota bacterium]